MSGWKAIDEAARCASAAYLRTPDLAKPAYAVLGHELIGVFANSDQDAFCSVTRKDGKTYFWFRGTEVDAPGASLISRIRQVWDNERMAPIAGKHAGFAMTGYYAPLVKLWDEQLKPFSQGPCLVGGHSMGAVRGLLASDLFGDNVAVEWIVFAPPDGATPDFWAANFPPGRKPPLLIGRSGDFALNHPTIGRALAGYRHAAPILKLNDGPPHLVPSWALTDEMITDHWITEYISDTSMLATYGTLVGCN